jgi:transposase InsO family protein
MVDDHSRLAYADAFQGRGENARQAVAFPGRGLALFAEHGVRVERVMSDNGSGYTSIAHAIACRTLGVRHTRIRPGRPCTNGKAERSIQTLLNVRARGAGRRACGQGLRDTRAEPSRLRPARLGGRRGAASDGLRG